MTGPGPDPTPALRLPAELTIYTAAETRSVWLGWLADLDDTGDGPCPVDGAGVAEVDAAGVQLLVALAHSLARRQRSLHLLTPSAPLAQACADLGLTDWLDNPAAAEALA